VCLIAPTSTRDSTATMMIAASAAFGRKNSSGVRNSVAMPTPTAVNAPAAGVCAPASKFTTERDSAPVTGKPPETAEPRSAAPSAISSWSGSTRWRRLAASVNATEIDST
jgi:hypothetical protein